MFGSKRFETMSFDELILKIHWSVSSNRVRKLLDLAIKKVSNSSQGVYLVRNYWKCLDSSQCDLLLALTRMLLRDNYKQIRELYEITNDKNWLKISAPVDDFAFCILMVEKLGKESKEAKDAYEKAKKFVFHTKQEVNFWELLELYMFAKNRAIWKRISKELHRKDGYRDSALPTVFETTQKKEVLILWMSKVEDISDWESIFRSCPVNLRKVVCKGIARYYLDIAADPKISKRKKM